MTDPLHTATHPPAADGDATRTASGDAEAALRDLITNTGVTVGTSETTGASDAPPGFVIERELGVGGMGVVYLARQQGLNRPVALKLVKGEQADAKSLIRFLAEAEAVASVRHPNVVEVHQFGEHLGRPYMALEFCPGGDLTGLTKAEQTRDGAWFRRVADLMAQVADGVNAAHAQGIVHRDLKPHNVFLAADGTPKVADFGLAKRGLGSDLTHTGAVMGTPAYMAPEQARGDTKFVGPEADVWALGVMLYELACGQRPIDTSGPVLDAVAKVAKGEVPPLREKCPAVPKDLARIAHKCLSIDPRDRYATAGGLSADLRNWLEGRPITARPAGAVEQAVKWAKRNKKLAGMGLAVLLTMAAATGVSLGFGLEANWQADRANRKQKDAEDAADRTREKADELTAQLKESRRVLDLSMLREADTDFERNAVQAARGKLTEIAPENRCLAWGLVRQRCDGVWLSLGGHAARVMSVGFSPDGTRVVTGSADRTARVWDATSGQTLVELRGHKGEVHGVGFSPDGTRVVSAAGDKSVRVWDAATGQTQATLVGDAKVVFGVGFSPDGKRIVSAAYDRTARVWDVSTGQNVATLSGHTGWVSSAVYSPDGTRIATGSSDNTARVWDAATGQSLAELRGHTFNVSSVAFTPDGRWVVTGSHDGTARVWDAATGRSLAEFKGIPAGVWAVALSPDGRRVVTGTDDGLAQVWHVLGGVNQVEVSESTTFLTCAAFSPDGKQVATGSTGLVGKTARVWDAVTGQTVMTLNGHSQRVLSVAFSPDGKRIVTGALDGTARVWEVATGQTPVTLRGQTREVSSVAYSPDGTRIVTGGGTLGSSELKVWDAVSGDQLQVLKGHSAWVSDVAYSPDGTRIVTASADKTGRIWEAATGRPLAELKGHTDSLRRLAISPDGRRVVTGSVDKTARVWDAATGQSLIELRGHTDVVSDVAFSPDGRRVVTGSVDKTARVWDAATGQSLIDLKMNESVQLLAISPDGHRIFAWTDYHLWIWDATAWLDPGGSQGALQDTRRRWLARPAPGWHARLAADFQADPFASGVQNSLEQQAHGQLALEVGDFQQAFGHFLAAELIRPKAASPQLPKK